MKDNRSKLSKILISSALSVFGTFIFMNMFVSYIPTYNVLKHGYQRSDIEAGLKELQINLEGQFLMIIYLDQEEN
jgi:hypothetical protein|tara:strand:- start:1546 stop:1770 length:225 start_codon:yes stop_codon:yes gene_type:complete